MPRNTAALTNPLLHWLSVQLLLIIGPNGKLITRINFTRFNVKRACAMLTLNWIGLTRFRPALACRDLVVSETIVSEDHRLENTTLFMGQPALRDTVQLMSHTQTHKWCHGGPTCTRVSNRLLLLMLRPGHWRMFLVSSCCLSGMYSVLVRLLATSPD